MKFAHRFTGSLLVASLSLAPLAALAAEGKKGLNAVTVQVVQMAGDPIPDIDITLDHYPALPPGGSEMVMPGDTGAAPTKRAKVDAGNALNAFGSARATDPPDADEDGYGDARRRAGEQTVKPGQGQQEDTQGNNEGGFSQDIDGNGRRHSRGGIGHAIIIKKSAEQLPPMEIGLPRTKGTVKFFNETKRVGGKVVDVLINVNGGPVCWPCSF